MCERDEAEIKIIRLNVGGQHFVTSCQTLQSCPEGFLARVVGGLIPSAKDETGAVFIDRCPKLFEKILAYLRTKRVRLGDIDIDDMISEADYYGIQSLLGRLKVCRQLRRSTCGNIAFNGFFPAMESADKITGADKIVHRICAADKWIAVAYTTGVSCYSTRSLNGEATSPKHTAWHRDTPSKPCFLALKCLKQATRDERWEQLLLACVTESSQLFVWQHNLESEVQAGESPEVVPVGVFKLFDHVDALFFAGHRQVVALNYSGDFAIWHYLRNFQCQKAEDITSYDESRSMLFFGHKKGYIKYFNVETLPVRMEDNKIILTELYRDSEEDDITALNVRISSNNLVSDFGDNQFHFEIAYGTAGGKVKLITEYAETIGHRPQLLFSFAVHRSPVTKILLCEHYLISNCADLNHVRTWQISRFRGVLSKNPLPVPTCSFKMLQLEPKCSGSQYLTSNNIGPHFLSDHEVWFLQKITPGATELYIISAISGESIHKIESVDSSPITSYTVIEEWTRAGSPTQYVFTGHENGTVQVWNIAALRVPMTKLESSSHQRLSSCGVEVREVLSPRDGIAQSPRAALETSSATLANSLPGVNQNVPTVDDILKMLDQYDISDASFLH